MDAGCCRNSDPYTFLVLVMVSIRSLLKIESSIGSLAYDDDLNLKRLVACFVGGKRKEDSECYIKIVRLMISTNPKNHFIKIMKDLVLFCFGFINKP